MLVSGRVKKQIYLQGDVESEHIQVTFKVISWREFTSVGSILVIPVSRGPSSLAPWYGNPRVGGGVMVVLV